MKRPSPRLFAVGLAAALAAVGVLAAGAARPGEVALAPLDVVGRLAVTTVVRAMPEPPAGPPRLLGTYEITYYWMANEASFRRPTGDPGHDVVLASRTCHPIATVSP